ncbi:MAG: hypothetical protein WC683_08180 [bacterium]
MSNTMRPCPRCASGMVSEYLDEDGEPQTCLLCHDRLRVSTEAAYQYRVAVAEGQDEYELMRTARFLYAKYVATPVPAYPAPF